MKLTKKFISLLIAVMMLVSVCPIINVSAAASVSKGTIDTRIKKLKNDLELVEGTNTKNPDWFWNKGMREGYQTDVMKKDIDNYIKTGNISYIKGHLTNKECAGRNTEEKNTHSNSVTVSGGRGCVSNMFEGRAQCWGFATYIHYYLFGCDAKSSASNFTSFKINDGSELRAGDLVEKGGHYFVYHYTNNNGELICIQANGYASSKPCRLNYGRVYRDSKNFHTTTSIKNANVVRYNNISNCSHDKVTFVSDEYVPCANPDCGYNFAYPPEESMGAYMDVIKENGSGTAPSHITPYGDAKVTERYKKGDTVYVVASATNGFKNLWYKLADGRWINEDYLGVHKHTKVDGYCTHCPEGMNIIELNNFSINAKKSGKFPVHFAPYGASPKFYRSGTVTVTGKAVNKHKNVWYKLSDGVWVYSDYLNPAVQSGKVKISGDTLALNTKAAKSGTKNSKQISELTNDTLITIYPGENVGRWYSVRAGNRVGYAYGDYITITDTTRAVEAYPCNTEPGLDVGDLVSVITPTPVTPTPVTPSTSSASVLYPTDQTYLNKIFVTETNACVVANIRKSSGSKVTVCGLLLYDGNGNLIKDHRENVSNVSTSNTNFHTWYDINNELKITLKGGTTYKYRFYTIVDGVTYYGETYSFTTKTPVNTVKASVLYPTEQTYLNKIFVTETNACVVANVKKNSGSNVTVCGLLLYDGNGNLIKDHRENISNVSASNTNFHTWYDINNELKITLKGGTTYKYRFYTIVDGVTYYGETYSFTTTPGQTPVKEEPKQEAVEQKPAETPEQEKVQDVYYKLIFDANGGTCGTSYKSVKFETNIGEMPVPVRNGYKFLGWSTVKDGKLISENTRYNVASDVTVYACWEKNEGTINMWIGKSYFEVNGKQRDIDAQGTKPVLVNGRTLVPIRAIAEAMGGTVEWNEAKRSVTISLGEHSVRLILYMPYAEVDGKYKVLDVAPEVIGGRTMVPVRFVAENLDVDILWNEADSRVTIVY